MKKVFTAEEIKKLEQMTCEQKQQDEIEIMYQAGYVLAKDFLSRVMPNINEEIAVISNVGNNGGDALVMFLELEKLGYNVKAYLFGNLDNASIAYIHYLGLVKKYLEIRDLVEFKKQMSNAKYIIDGIFGIGLDRDVSGDLKFIIKTINDLEKVVYAIDLPSGIHPDSGLAMGIAMKACYTGVIGNYKLGNFLNDALDYHGDINLLDIGLLEGYSDVYYLDLKEANIARERIHNSNKYTYGHNAYIGSSVLPGAINMSALAALKTGTGLVEVFYDGDIIRFNQDIIYHKFDESLDMSKFDAIVFGPGISQIYQPYQEMIDRYADKKKMLIDAGGLKYLSKDKKYENVIITPHIGELSAFTKMSKEEISQNPISCLRKLAKNGLTVVLKGPTTIVQGQRYTYLLQAKNTGLATAGTGDVLAGIISSYMVDDSLVNACVRGVAVHSIAAEYAKQKFGEVSMTASDLIDNLYKVWVRKR